MEKKNPSALENEIRLKSTIHQTFLLNSIENYQKPNENCTNGKLLQQMCTHKWPPQRSKYKTIALQNYYNFKHTNLVYRIHSPLCKPSFPIRLFFIEVHKHTNCSKCANQSMLYGFFSVTIKRYGNGKPFRFFRVWVWESLYEMGQTDVLTHKPLLDAIALGWIFFFHW